MASDLDATRSLVDVSSANSVIAQLHNFKLAKIFNSSFIYEKLKQGFLVYKAWPNEIVDYISNKNVQPEITTTLSEKAFTIFVSVGSLTGAYFFLQKIKKFYQEKQKLFKRNKEDRRIEEEIKIQQLIVHSNRANPLNDINDKRKLCIICIHNRRECVFLDCGHICVCVDCLKALPFPKTCPICRCKIIQTVLLLHA